MAGTGGNMSNEHLEEHIRMLGLAELTKVILQGPGEAIGFFEDGDRSVGTGQVKDSLHEYETCIKHPEYNDGYPVVVENSDTKEEAVAAYDHWVSLLTSEDLPDSLEDVSMSRLAQMADEWTGKGWRHKPRRRATEA